MAIKGSGPSAVAAMWSLTTATFVFALLRAYTRIYHVRSVGMDDYVYNFAFILLLLYTIFITVSATYGFGQDMADILDPQDIVDAILYEAIGQVFLVVGMALAKWSLGLFLLRIVVVRWHSVLIWSIMSILLAGSISVCFVFMLQCTPPAYLWDRRIPGGYCHIDTTILTFVNCSAFVVADFFFALFPWYFMWRLNMNKREKLVILISMSFGVLAGACGIWRTLEIPSLSSANYLKDTVGLVVWSAAEMSVTMICLSIPVCRPLYKNYLDRLMSTKSSKDSGLSGSRQIALRTFGGSTMYRLEDNPGVVNESQEAAIQPGYRRRESSGKSDDEGMGIRVTHEYRVTSS